MTRTSDTAGRRSWLIRLGALAVVAGAAVVAALPAPASASTAVRPRLTVTSVPQATTVVAAATALPCSVVSRLRLCTHGDDSRLSRSTSAAGEGSGQQTSTASTRVGCYGDGQSGPRIQALYIRPTTTADHLSSVLPSLRGWAGGVEKAIDDSAHQTKGSRHVRFVTTPSGSSCQLSVLSLALPPDAFNSFNATVSALQKQGLKDSGTKYLIWSEGSGYCGIASMYDDAKASAENLNNGAFPTYARIDKKCWGYAEAHEIVHMLGGVQKSAPHATAGWHCRDGGDLMCYDDGSAGSRQTSVCPSSQASLLDCRHDDYFSTAPAAGSWLASHWNVATSGFLSAGWTDPAPAAPQPDAQPDGQPDPPQPSPGPTSSPGPKLPLPLPSPFVGQP